MVCNDYRTESGETEKLRKLSFSHIAALAKLFEEIVRRRPTHRGSNRPLGVPERSHEVSENTLFRSAIGYLC